VTYTIGELCLTPQERQYKLVVPVLPTKFANLIGMCVLVAYFSTVSEGMACQVPPAASVQATVEANDIEANNPLTVGAVGPQAADAVEQLHEALLGGWRKESSSTSLEECNNKLRVPEDGAAWWKQWAAYVGVGFLVPVG